MRSSGWAGNASYYSVIVGTNDCNGNSVTNNSGDQSVRGNWLTDFQSSAAQALTNAATIAVSFSGGSPSYALRTVRVTDSGAVTGIILQKGYHACQEITVVNEGPEESRLMSRGPATWSMEPRM